MVNPKTRIPMVEIWFDTSGLQCSDKDLKLLWATFITVIYYNYPGQFSCCTIISDLGEVDRTVLRIVHTRDTLFDSLLFHQVVPKVKLFVPDEWLSSSVKWESLFEEGRLTLVKLTPEVITTK